VDLIDKMIRALVLDFDGLILETEGPIFQSWQELYRRYQCEMALADWQQNIGSAFEAFDPISDLERLASCTLDQEKDLRWRVRRELELIEAQSPQPGVEKMLRRAKELGLKIGLASSSPCKWVVTHLDRLGLLSYFDVLTARDDVAHTKPAPDLYLTAVEWLGIAPSEAVAFEDSLHGLVAAKQAGLYCVVVPTELTASLPLGDADLRLNSLADLTLDEILARFS
jgi:HAD superfamily hydrolase (TIGR01509 family)